MLQSESVDRATRIAAAEEVCRHVLACYGEDVLGVAIYGSVARGDDGPYSKFVRLANRQHYPTGRYIWSMAVRLPQQPRDYAALLPVVAGFRTLDPAEVFQAAETLWQRLETFAEERGVRLGDLTIGCARRSTQ